jgi:transcription elongation factor Elf1
MKTKLQLWKATSWQCPHCKSKEFWIEVESRVSLIANSPFTSELVKRVRIVCKNCGKRFENSEPLKGEK